jgi:hypothetical protein
LGKKTIIEALIVFQGKKPDPVIFGAGAFQGYDELIALGIKLYFGKMVFFIIPTGKFGYLW